MGRTERGEREEWMDWKQDEFDGEPETAVSEREISRRQERDSPHDRRMNAVWMMGAGDVV